MKGKIFLIACLFLAATACNNNSNETDGSEDRDSSVMEPSAALNFAAAFPDLNHYFSRQDTSFNAGLLEPGEMVIKEDSALVFPLDMQEFSLYKNYYLYNEDSSFALDLVSYNYLPVRKKDTVILEEQGPDFEVAIIDLQKRSRSRLFFLGASGGNILDAKWIDRYNVMLAGALDWQNRDSLRPAAWKYNVLNKTWQQFTYPEMVRADWNGFNKPLYQLGR